MRDGASQGRSARADGAVAGRASGGARSAPASAAPAPVVLAPFARVARVPLHHQIREDLELNLNSGRFQPGAELPGEAALCAHYGASRGTIRHALADLAREGVVERHAGRGSFLRRPKIEGSVVGSYRRFRVEGPPLDPGGKVLSLTRRRADANLAELLGLGAERAVHVLRRLRFADGVPVTLQTSYLPVGLAPALRREDLDARHLVDILQQDHGVVLTRSEELIAPGIVDEHDARHLRVATGAPVFRIERRSYLPDGRVGEFRRAVMRGDIYRYRLDLR
jgi:GntR family transcriptional regulator